MNKIIYSLKVMVQLVEMGNIPILTMENPKYPDYKCWVFEMTEELLAMGYGENKKNVMIYRLR